MTHNPFTTTIVITDGSVVKPYINFVITRLLTRMSCNVMGPVTLLCRALLQHLFLGDVYRQIMLIEIMLNAVSCAVINSKGHIGGKVQETSSDTVTVHVCRRHYCIA